jgi:hypothetical protein
MNRARFAILVAFLCLFLGGCVSDERLAQLEAMAKHAQEGAARSAAVLAQAEEANQAARATLASAQQLADASGSKAAQEAVAKAQEGLARAEAALPTMRAAVEASKAAADTATTAVEQAKAAREAGASGLEIVVGLALSALTGGAASAVPLLRSIRQWRTATKLAARYGERLELAESDADVDLVKDRSAREQVASGVHGLIAAARGKA